ncbi:MAG: hypothetical protein LBR28_01115 [Bacteroidales bacterium]|jgi:LEA14-like dessication related protein|nr:hypothetical protein [Bacteroidales bacterium]
MKRVFAVIVCTIVFSSCTVVQIVYQIPKIKTIIKIEKHQVEVCKNNCQHFEIKDDHLVLPIKYNNTNDTAIFDTGLTDAFTITGNETLEKDSTLSFPTTTPSGRKQVRFQITKINLENDLLKWENHLAEKVFMDSIPCMTNTTKKILGINAFYDSAIIVLDFDGNKVCIFDTIASMDVNDYFEVKSFFKRVPYVFVKLWEREYRFIFDLGCAFPMIMNTADYVAKQNDITFEGATATDVSGIIYGETHLRIGDTLILADTVKTEVNEIWFSDNFTSNLIGLPFISEFNWIIDCKNKKIYAQRRTDFTPKKVLKEYLYKTMVKDNNLVIASRNKTANPPLKLNTVIKSVNGELITADNLCFYMELLNKTVDWGELSVEVRQ